MDMSKSVPPKPPKRKKIVATTDMKVFVEQWDRKIDKIIASHGLKDLADDIKQDIYCNMIIPDSDPESPTFGMNGLERFDPKRGAFSTYVYALVLTRVRNARSRRIRELGLMPFSHDMLTPNNSEDGKSARLKDRNEAHAYELAGKASNMERTEFQMQVDNILEVLRFYPVRSDFYREGECVTRDLVSLLQLILGGKSREEIVEYFEYSTGSVGVMFDQLRKVPELLELKEMIPGMTSQG